MIRLLFWIFIVLLLGVFAVSLGTAIKDNLSERQSHYDKIEAAQDCDTLRSEYRVALEFEREYWDGGESEEITYLERSIARELGCP